jgi:ribosomal protein S12 methylthiotransferase accessory factor
MSLRAILSNERKDPSRKRYLVGTHRAIAPAETLNQIRSLLPIYGITRVANVTGLDKIGLPVVAVYRPNAKSISVDQGKGRDLVAAKVSGIMEAVETYLAEHITLPLKLISYEDIRLSHNTVDPFSLPKTVDASFDPDSAMLWIEGYDLLQRENIWMPHQMVHLDCSIGPLPGDGCFSATSTGLASGNHLPEAIVHGICEVIERDAVTLWRLQSAAERDRSRIDLATVCDNDCQLALGRIFDAGLFPAIWNATSDLGVPTFVCQILEHDSGSHLPFAVATGTGSHQSNPARFAPEYADQVRSSSTPASLRDIPSHESDLFLHDIDWLLRRLEIHGLTRVIVVDLSRPEINASAVRVIIPGLEDGEDLPTYVPGLRATAVVLARQ